MSNILLNKINEKFKDYVSKHIPSNNYLKDFKINSFEELNNNFFSNPRKNYAEILLSIIFYLFEEQEQIEILKSLNLNDKTKDNGTSLGFIVLGNYPYPYELSQNIIKYVFENTELDHVNNFSENILTFIHSYRTPYGTENSLLYNLNQENTHLLIHKLNIEKIEKSTLCNLFKEILKYESYFDLKISIEDKIFIFNNLDKVSLKILEKDKYFIKFLELKNIYDEKHNLNESISLNFEKREKTNNTNKI